MGSYIGKKPTDVPLTSSDINDNIITSAKIVDGAITGDDINSTFNISGKTVTLPSASVTAHASDYIAWQSVVTAATLTAVAGRGYPIDTTSNACTITLPATASVGDTIKFVDYARKWGTNKITLNTNSLKFQGYTTPNPEYNTNGQAVTITYIDTTQGWIPTVDDDSTHETEQSYAIQYLVVAGGGSGGAGHRAGGGGAGGYRNSYASETSGRNASTESPPTIDKGTVLTITVGAGGAMPNAGSDASGNGTTGSTSSIVGTGVSISSNGGGGGGSYEQNAPSGTFGSGAGAGHQNNTNKYGSDGTAGQGFDGGDIPSSTAQQGSCGGGASENGDAGGSSSSRAGGDGLSSSISGSAVTRAGGGGAGSYGSGEFCTGGSGGGGNGASDDSGDAHSGVANGGYYYPVSGTANTGGGGGGQAGSQSNGTAYGSGGSGVVILRMSAGNYSGTTTGSPTVSDSGGDKVLVFNGDGSYTV